MCVIKQALIFPVAAFNFSVMTGSIGPNELMANAELVRHFLEQRLFIFLTIGETISEFKTVVGLYAFNFYAMPLKLLNNLL